MKKKNFSFVILLIGITISVIAVSAASSSNSGTNISSNGSGSNMDAYLKFTASVNAIYQLGTYHGGFQCYYDITGYKLADLDVSVYVSGEENTPASAIFVEEVGYEVSVKNGVTAIFPSTGTISSFHDTGPSNRIRTNAQWSVYDWQFVYSADFDPTNQGYQSSRYFYVTFSDAFVKAAKTSSGGHSHIGIPGSTIVPITFPTRHFDISGPGCWIT